MPKLSDYTKIKRLGNNAFGESIDLSKLSEEEKELQKKEIDNLKKIHSPYVIQLYNSFEEDNILFIETEFCEGGSLDNAIKEKRKENMRYCEDEIWKYLIQLSIGICSVHSLAIVHRDLKSENILLDKNRNIKIKDLGISKRLNSEDSKSKSKVGVRFHIAPELLTDDEYGMEVDAWSLGWIGYELCCLQPSFFVSVLLDLNIISMDDPKIPEAIPGKVDGYSKLLCDTIHSLLKKDPRKRIKVEEMLNNSEVKRIGRRLKIDLGLTSSLTTVILKCNDNNNFKISSSKEYNVECDICLFKIPFKDCIKHYQTYYPSFVKMLKRK